jgi:hypothetical protein
MQTRQIDITAFGETRTFECVFYGDRTRINTLARCVIGRFPTGTKLHPSQLTLWKREQPTGRALRGETAAIIDGDEYVIDTTLYTHNRNVGRIIGWNDLDRDAAVVARW